MPSEPVLVARGLSKRFARAARPALSSVDLSLGRGRTLGLVGPSGSGKSTLARCLAMFEQPDTGEILFEGRNLLAARSRERALLRPLIQIVFQQPAAALNPRFTAEDVIAEPLLVQKRTLPAVARRRAAEVMESIGLSRDVGSRPALSFSGGERQRLALARALVLEPKVLILDESFAGLDLPVRTQILALLKDGQQRLGTAYILIAHDLRLVSRFADELAVMDSGSIVERGPSAEVTARPSHPRTVQMLEAAAALSLTPSTGEARP